MNWYPAGTIIVYAASSHFVFSVNKDLQEAFEAIISENFFHHQYVIYRATGDEHLEFVCYVSDKK